MPKHNVISAVLRAASDVSLEGGTIVSIQQLCDRVAGYAGFALTPSDIKHVADRFLVPCKRTPDIYTLSLDIE